MDKHFSEYGCCWMNNRSSRNFVESQTNHLFQTNAKENYIALFVKNCTNEKPGFMINSSLHYDC